MTEYCVKLKLKSPLVVGGHRFVNNVFYSLDYITGSVLRAAFVRQILLNCPLFDENAANGSGKYNFVYIRDEAYCKNCPAYYWCKHFSSIKFSFFYPEGAEIIPVTSKKCKDYDDHCFIDAIAGTEKTKCVLCQKDDDESPLGRLENKKGFRKGRTFISLHQKRCSFTKTAIDPYTRKAQDGYLYAMNAIREGTVFEGTILLPDEISGIEGINSFFDKIISNETGLPIPVLYIGKRSASGFGKTSIAGFSKKDKAKKDLQSGLKQFNDRIRSNSLPKPLKENKMKTYVPILSFG